MDPDKPVVLLVGGGEGMGPVEATVDALSKIVDCEFQAVVVCGRNRKLQGKLNKRYVAYYVLERRGMKGPRCGRRSFWCQSKPLHFQTSPDANTDIKICLSPDHNPVANCRAYPPNMIPHIMGFVNNMPEYMFASDIIITKAGPGTISEALICGLPMILNGYIPCQEEANVPYVLENGVGVFERKPALVAATVKSWFTDRASERQAMAARCKALGHPAALFNIVRELAQMVVP